MGFKQPVQLRQNTKQQSGEIQVANVTSGHDQKLGGSAAQEMTSDEISILTEDYPSIAVGNGTNQVVGGAIALWKIKGVEDIATQLFQRPNERLRQLGIQQDPHAETGSIR
jgi:hypothetical protein